MRMKTQERRSAMKKLVSLSVCVVMLLALCACGGKKAAAEWTRTGYFMDENNNLLSVTWMEDIDEPGWYVGLMLGDIMAGGTLPQVENTLQGSLSTWDEGAEPLSVTVSEEGEDGLKLVAGGEAYHFTPYDMPEAAIFVSVNTEGWGGMIGYEAGETAPELDPERPYQSAQINLAEPETYTLAAAPEAGSLFVKWTKNGEDFSTEPVITVLLDESADFVAVFEEDPDWQNPVMNFIGEYQCDRAHALVECFGNDEAWITIEWGSSAWEPSSSSPMTTAARSKVRSRSMRTAQAPSRSATTAPLPGTRINPRMAPTWCSSGFRRRIDASGAC